MRGKLLRFLPAAQCVRKPQPPLSATRNLGFVDYLLEQRRLGRIRYLGFSSHGQMDNLRAFLDLYGKEMAFCQIQLNYLDWTFQKAKENTNC